MLSIFTDAAELKISRATLSKMTADQFVFSAKRRIPGVKKIEWAIHVCGENLRTGNNPCVFLWVSKGGLEARGTVAVGPVERYEGKFFKYFDNTATKQCIVKAFHPSRLGEHGTIFVQVTFLDPNGHNLTPPTTIDYVIANPKYATDARIEVDGRTIDVHRHFLCLISPVFLAELTHDTIEAKTGTIKIKDFSYETVKNAIDYCHGREYVADTLSDVVDILMFADKYDMKVPIAKFEPYLDDDLELDNFAAVVKYAWALEKKDIKTKCIKFYRDNHAKITLTPGFASLNPSTKLDIIDSATLLEQSN